MRNEDSGVALQTGEVKVAPTRVAPKLFDAPAKPAVPVSGTQTAPRRDPDSKAALA